MYRMFFLFEILCPVLFCTLKSKQESLSYRKDDRVMRPTCRVGQKTGPLCSNFRNIAQIYTIFLQKSKSFHFEHENVIY